MNTLLKLLFSFIIGLVAMGISKLIHPEWTLIHLSIFGLIIFVVTFVLSLIIK